MTTADGDGGGSASPGVAPTAAEIEAAEASLETWLVEQAEAGVPETVLVGVLREYAADVERLGPVPRP